MATVSLALETAAGDLVRVPECQGAAGAVLVDDQAVLATGGAVLGIWHSGSGDRRRGSGG